MREREKESLIQVYYIMKSTKVQNPRRILLHAIASNYANVRARKLATPRVVAVTRGAVSSRSNKIVRARLNVVDNRWASWVFPCGSAASITVNTKL